MPVKPRQVKRTLRSKAVSRKARPEPAGITPKPVGKSRTTRLLKKSMERSDLMQATSGSAWMDWLKGTGDPLVNESLAELRERLALTRLELARGTGLSERTIATLEKSGHRKAPAGTRRKVEEFVRLCLALDEFGPEGGLGSWMRAPQEWLAGSTPLHAIEVGRMDWLWRLVYQLRSGEPM